VGVPKDQFNSRSFDRTRLTNINTGEQKPVQGPLPVASRGGGSTAGAPGKIPFPDSKGRVWADQARGATTGPGNDLRRGASQPVTGMQRAGVPPVSGSGKSTAATALDALHRGGPAALTTSPSRDQAVVSRGSPNLRRDGAPPPVPQGSNWKGGGSTMDALHNSGASSRPGAANAVPSTLRSTDVRRAEQPPVVRGAGKPGSSPEAFQRLRTSPPSAGARMPEVPDLPRAYQAAPRRMASVSRQEGRSGGEKPPMPNMQAFRAPSQNAAPAPSAGMRSPGNAPTGGFSRGGGSSGAAPSFGRAGGSAGHSGGFGGKLGH
jgi:hypothetical protein